MSGVTHHRVRLDEKVARCWELERWARWRQARTENSTARACAQARRTLSRTFPTACMPGRRGARMWGRGLLGSSGFATYSSWSVRGLGGRACRCVTSVQPKLCLLPSHYSTLRLR